MVSLNAVHPCKPGSVLLINDHRFTIQIRHMLSFHQVHSLFRFHCSFRECFLPSVTASLPAPLYIVWGDMTLGYVFWFFLSGAVDSFSYLLFSMLAIRRHDSLV